MVNGYLISRVPFVFALLTAEQMNTIAVISDLIEVTQKKYLLAL